MQFTAGEPGRYDIVFRLPAGHQPGQYVRVRKAGEETGPRRLAAGGGNAPLRAPDAASTLRVSSAAASAPIKAVSREALLSAKPPSVKAPDAYPLQPVPGDAPAPKTNREGNFRPHSSLTHPPSGALLSSMRASKLSPFAGETKPVKDMKVECSRGGGQLIGKRFRSDSYLGDLVV